MKRARSSTAILTGDHPERGTLYAAIDAGAHHVTGRVADRRFGAFLSPFASMEAAQAALAAEGCRELAQ